MTKVLLLAASGLAREVIAASREGLEIVAILDDDEALHGSRIAGIEVLGGIDLAAGRPESLVACIGSGRGRRGIVDRLDRLGVGDDRWATLLDDSVRMPPGCSIGVGSVLLAGVVLTASVTVGRHVVVMPNSTITHNNVLEDFVTIAAGVSLGGTVRVGAESYLGMNASVRQNLRIGEGATIGMGSAVLSDVPAGETWVGVPARRLAGRSGEGE